MNQTKKILLLSCIGFLLVISLGLTIVFASSQFSTILRRYDAPTQLSGKQETIEVTYINWACACANYLDVRLFAGDSMYEVQDKDCFFITPANPAIVVPESFGFEERWDCNLRLTGQFYFDEGIPTSYISPSPEKPEYARVFLNSHFELVTKD